MLHQLRPLQHRQVLGDSRLRDVGIPRKRMNSLLALSNQLLEDGSSGRIGKSAEYVICYSGFHIKTITIWLLIVKIVRRNLA